jgi:demethylmenaquinone methyltransferase/2-methoxy-6-polyprenyl-1,4-benzoquinol methylase
MRYYPESKVEVQGFEAKYYDTLLNVLTFGVYSSFIKRVVKDMNISPEDKILDMGAGTGRNALLMHKYLNEKGKIVGLDISPDMIRQFKARTVNIPNIELREQRIDVPFETEEKFDKVFISFVIHGFPHEVRLKVIQNAFNSLKPGGQFIILDFAEFKIKEMPFYARFVFTTVECKYAFDFVERNWKEILAENGFGDFEEKHYLMKYVRLLKARKKEG